MGNDAEMNITQEPQPQPMTEYNRQIAFINESIVPSHDGNQERNAIEGVRLAIMNANAQIPAGHGVRQEMIKLYEKHSELMRNFGENMPKIAADARRYILIVKRMDMDQTSEVLERKLQQVAGSIKASSTEVTRYFDGFVKDIEALVVKMIALYGGGDYVVEVANLSHLKEHEFYAASESVRQGELALAAAEGDCNYAEHRLNLEKAFQQGREAAYAALNASIAQINMDICAAEQQVFEHRNVTENIVRGWWIFTRTQQVITDNGQQVYEERARRLRDARDRLMRDKAEYEAAPPDANRVPQMERELHLKKAAFTAAANALNDMRAQKEAVFQEWSGHQNTLKAQFEKLQVSDAIAAKAITDLTTAASEFQVAVSGSVHKIKNHLETADEDALFAVNAVPDMFRLILFNDAISSRIGAPQLLAQIDNGSGVH